MRELLRYHSRLKISVKCCCLGDGHEGLLVDAGVPGLVEGVCLNLQKEEEE